jgi:hypothetical protein
VTASSTRTVEGRTGRALMPKRVSDGQGGDRLAAERLRRPAVQGEHGPEAAIGEARYR